MQQCHITLTIPTMLPLPDIPFSCCAHSVTLTVFTGACETGMFQSCTQKDTPAHYPREKARRNLNALCPGYQLGFLDRCNVNRILSSHNGDTAAVFCWHKSTRIAHRPHS